MRYWYHWAWIGWCLAVTVLGVAQLVYLWFTPTPELLPYGLGGFLIGAAIGVSISGALKEVVAYRRSRYMDMWFECSARGFEYERALYEQARNN